MSHSRWLTTASRVCRTYISIEEPSSDLKMLVEYILRVYTPIALEIKRHPSCLMGARHIHALIKSSHYLKDVLQTNALKPFRLCIQRNAFFAHPENILLAMTNDDRQPIRALAYRRILQARIQTSSNSLRKYKVPLLKFHAKDYVDLIDWQRVQPEDQMPPLLRDLLITEENIEELAMFKISNEDFKGKMRGTMGEEVPYNIDLKNIPCHSQAVERCVKVVTEASKHVSNESQREGYIIAKLRHRSLMPLLRSKKQFSATKISADIQPKL